MLAPWVEAISYINCTLYLVHKGSNEDGKLATALPVFSGREQVK
jgi:hypothetical protein